MMGKTGLKNSHLKADGQRRHPQAKLKQRQSLKPEKRRKSRLQGPGRPLHHQMLPSTRTWEEQASPPRFP